ncbi:hypothetical protein ES705_15221 [subsurface metagenome]
MTLEEFLTIEINRWKISSIVFNGTEKLSLEENLKYSPMADPYQYLVREITKYVERNYKPL